MSTRTTFEDRLLGELKREIELRETPARTTGGRARTSVLRRFTPRRIAVVTAACAAAWTATVVVPGSPADAGAYAAERHDDGSVEITVRDPSFGIDAQLALAERVRPWGIKVNVVAREDVCSSWGVPRVMVLTAAGDPIRSWPVTLRRGSTLVIDNSWGEPVSKDEIEHYEVKPCDR
ncbi:MULTISPECIES: hypothetical protein [Streptomyces]|jgi:hypothetical protein|uniref:hypothetical protein n=1 Tax=Streptomyces TaxID=1883 RepID=UPI0005ECB2B0|nr:MULTISPECIES: hypothetical protein [Streptomyces]